MHDFKLLEMHLLTTSERISLMAFSTSLDTLFSISLSGLSQASPLLLSLSASLHETQSQSQLVSTLPLLELEIGLQSQLHPLSSECWLKLHSPQPDSSKHSDSEKHSC